MHEHAEHISANSSPTINSPTGVGSLPKKARKVDVNNTVFNFLGRNELSLGVMKWTSHTVHSGFTKCEDHPAQRIVKTNLRYLSACWFAYIYICIIYTRMSNTFLRAILL